MPFHSLVDAPEHPFTATLVLDKHIISTTLDFFHKMNIQGIIRIKATLQNSKPMDILEVGKEHVCVSNVEVFWFELSEDILSTLSTLVN